MTDSLQESHDDWKKSLSDEEYRVLREKGTETPFTGAYVDNKQSGMYRCKGCGALLFSSDAKFDSGTGWPSFDDAIPGSVTFVHDDAHGMSRTEVVCAQCKGHLGHVFDDGPKETTGKRYCINSVCLAFDKEEKTNQQTN